MPKPSRAPVRQSVANRKGPRRSHSAQAPRVVSKVKSSAGHGRQGVRQSPPNS
jgi:hypothetical protein